MRVITDFKTSEISKKMAQDYAYNGELLVTFPQKASLGE